MAKKEKAAKAPRVKKPKAPKMLTVTRYAVTTKEAANLADKKNQALTAVAYGVLADSKSPLTSKEILAELTEGQAKRMEGNFRSTLWNLEKSGYIKITKHQEEKSA